MEEEKSNVQDELKLDYSITSPQERNELVQRILQNTPEDHIIQRYLNILSDYLIFAMDKEERKQKKILTDNRMVTVNKRETSFEGLAEKLENGEDGIYNMITNDKNAILTPKISITQQDLDEIPPLRQLRAEINKVEAQFKAATGKRKFLLKKQLIEMRQDQYVIKSAYRRPIYCMNAVKSFSQIDFGDNITVTDDGQIIDKSLVSFFDPKHISLLLCNYSKLKEDLCGEFTKDAYYVIQDLDNLVDKALKDRFPLYYDLLIYKIDGKSNLEIQGLLQRDYQITYSIEYISSLWRNKIPKIIADQAEKDYLIWYYTSKHSGKWKRCSRCGQIKLAHNKFFSQNKTSKDGWYSMCKDCRNHKDKK